MLEQTFKLVAENFFRIEKKIQRSLYLQNKIYWIFSVMNDALPNSAESAEHTELPSSAPSSEMGEPTGPVGEPPP